jgi:hypothetical protein
MDTEKLLKLNKEQLPLQTCHSNLHEEVVALTRLNFKAFWGLERVIFRTLKDEKRKSEAESIVSKPPTQMGGLSCPLCCSKEPRCWFKLLL